MRIVIVAAVVIWACLLGSIAARAQQCSMACDINGDALPTVSIQDYAAFNASYGKKTGDAGFNARADLNGDGTISIADYGLMLKFCPLLNR